MKPWERVRRAEAQAKEIYAHFRLALMRQEMESDTPYKGKGRALTDGEIAASRCRMFAQSLRLQPVVIPEGPNLTEHIVAKYGGFETARPRRRC